MASLKQPNTTTPAHPIPQRPEGMPEVYAQLGALGWRVVARHGDGLTEAQARFVVALVNAPSREVEELRKQIDDDARTNVRWVGRVMELRALVRRIRKWIDDHGSALPLKSAELEEIDTEIDRIAGGKEAARIGCGEEPCSSK